MKSDLVLQEKQIINDTETQRQVRTVPLPENLEKCKDCPYPRVGFICWDTDGSCMRSEVNKINSKPGR